MQIAKDILRDYKLYQTKKFYDNEPADLQNEVNIWKIKI